MFGKYLKPGILVVGLGLLILTEGCATTRFITSPDKPEELGLRAANQNIEAKLHHIIMPGGTGSWVQDARWMEFKIGLKTLTDSDMTLERFELIDHRGVYVAAEQSLGQLESQTDYLAKQYGSVMTQTLTGTALSAAMSGMSSGIGRSGASMIPLLGGLSQIAPMTSMMGQYSEAKDKESIEAEFQKRRLPTPIQLSGKADLEGGIFFPISPKPRALLIHYRSAQGAGQLKLSLDSVWSQAAQEAR